MKWGKTSWGANTCPKLGFGHKFEIPVRHSSGIAKQDIGYTCLKREIGLDSYMWESSECKVFFFKYYR